MKYAVLRLLENTGRYSFSKWHETEEEAIEEACRLAEKEDDVFAVLKYVGEAKVPKQKAEFFMEVPHD